MATIAEIKERLDLIKRFKELQTSGVVMAFFSEAIENQLIGFAENSIGWGLVEFNEECHLVFNGYKVYTLSDKGLLIADTHKDEQFLKLLIAELEKIKN